MPRRGRTELSTATHLDARVLQPQVLAAALRFTLRNSLLQNGLESMKRRWDPAASILKQAIEALSDGFVIFDHERRLVLCNDRFRQIYGPAGGRWKAGTAIDVIARDTAFHCLGLTDPEEIQGFVTARVAELREPGPLFEQHMADGRWIGVRDSVLANGWVVGTRSDITELKRAQGELHALTENLEQRVQIRTAELVRTKNELEREVEERRRAVERFADFAEVAADWFWEMDADLRFTYFSERAEQVTGVPIEFHLGKTRAELAGEDVDSEKWRRHFAALDNREIFRQFRYERRGHDGRLQWLSTSGKPVFDEQGTFLGYRGSGTDISAEMAALEGLRQAKEQAEQRAEELRRTQRQLLRKERLATVGQLTASVAHELRNPLGAIANALASIERLVPEESERLERSVALALRNVGRCNRIISELTDFTRVIELETEPRDVDEWLERVLDEYALPDGVALHRCLGAGATVRLDDVRMHQAVDNLLDNACHAMREAGSTRPQELRVSVRREGEAVELWVDDSGPGIEEDVATQVFEPLYTTKSFGLGLGLPIVKQIIEQHGGDISLGDAPDGGMRAAIRLPLEAG